MNQLPLFSPPAYTVSDLTAYLRALLEMDEILRDVWVQGEISNLSKPSSGHLYFTLKDSGAALKCVIWRSTAVKLRFSIQNGMAVEAHGGIGVYERDGQYQLYVDTLRPAGEGRLFAEFMRLKARLEAEGLFDEERKRQIPLRPNRIGIVTSPTGAALQDMLNTLRRRYPLAEVILSPCAVQGDAAPLEIIKALRDLCALARPDVIIMARGGGSLEDLWAFNDERVVRAIVSSPVPVITGVGHETDFTLADFACDLRAPTPTGAAVLATPDRADLLVELRELSEQLSIEMTARIERSREDIDYTLERLSRVSPLMQVRSGRQQVDSLSARTERVMGHLLALQRAHLGGAASRLQALNPASILMRGFALVEREGGGLIRSAREAQPGEAVSIRLADGRLGAHIDDVDTGDTA